MLAQYVEVEEEKEEEKPVTTVHFDSDYDITDFCTRFGNWSRLGLYQKQKTPSYFHNQPKKLKDICSDDDAKIMNECWLAILDNRVNGSKDVYDVIYYFYFGEKTKIIDNLIVTGNSLGKNVVSDEIYLVKPLTIQEIAKKLDINWNATDKLKKKGEDFINGYLLSMEKNLGKTLEMKNNIKYLK